jgi:RHS repeat-associated protein
MNSQPRKRLSSYNLHLHAIPNANDTTPDIRWGLSDHLGSSTIEYDTSGYLKREEYTPFGETSFGSYSKKRYRFCGKELDGESGLYYYGMRYYAPWTCKFVSLDPLWAKYPFYTPYQYAGNKPINYNDLDGAEENRFESSVYADQDETAPNGQGEVYRNSSARPFGQFVVNIQSVYMTERAINFRDGYLALPREYRDFNDYLVRGAVNYAATNQYANDWHTRAYQNVAFPSQGGIAFSNYYRPNASGSGLDIRRTGAQMSIYGTTSVGTPVLLGEVFLPPLPADGDQQRTGPYGGFSLQSSSGAASHRDLMQYGSSAEYINLDDVMRILPGASGHTPRTPWLGGMSDLMRIPSHLWDGYNRGGGNSSTIPQWALRENNFAASTRTLPQDFGEYAHLWNWKPDYYTNQITGQVDTSRIRQYIGEGNAVLKTQYITVEQYNNTIGRQQPNSN